MAPFMLDHLDKAAETYKENMRVTKENRAAKMDVGNDPVSSNKNPSRPYAALYGALASLANMKGHMSLNCDIEDWDVVRGVVFVVPFDLSAQGYLEKLTQSPGDDDSINQMA